MTSGEDCIIELFRALRAELYLSDEGAWRDPTPESVKVQKAACERSLKLFCDAFATTLEEMDVLIGFKDSKAKRTRGA
jgi:hypothetical protein